MANEDDDENGFAVSLKKITLFAFKLDLKSFVKYLVIFIDSCEVMMVKLIDREWGEVLYLFRLWKREKHDSSDNWYKEGNMRVILKYDRIE